MKLKGINPIEQHVEKIVLGVFGALALGVLVWQFFTSNAASVGKDQPIAPDKAAEYIADLAATKERALQSQTVPDGLTAMSTAGSRAAFDQALAATQNMPTAVALTRGGVTGGSDLPVGSAPVIVSTDGAEVTVPQVPAPGSVIAAVNEGTLDPFEVVRNPELSAFVGEAQPYDMFAVTVQATVDSDVIRAAFTAKPSGDGQVAIPMAWLDDALEIVGVELRRAEVMADGSTGPEVVVSALPGRVDLPSETASADFKPSALPDLVKKEEAMREEVRRPRFYDTIAGPYWLWPAARTEVGVSGVNADEIKRLLREKASLEADIARFDKLLEELEKEPEGKPDAPNTGPGVPVFDDEPMFPEGKPSLPIPSAIPPVGFPAPPIGPVGQGGRDAPTGTAPPPTAEPRGSGRKQALLNQRAAKAKRLAEVEAELTALGYSPTPVEKDYPVFSEPNLSLMDPKCGPVTVWAHDVTATPGAVYRYRVAIKVINPLFGHADALPESQKELAFQPLLVSEPSEWSEPVAVLDKRQFFVTSARDSRGLSGTGAGVELFVFHYGYWRRASVSLIPGDELAALVDLPELPVFAVEKDAQTGQPRVVGEPTMGDDELAISMGAFLLDAARVAANTGDVFEVFFRAANPGAIIKRQTRGDLESEIRDALAASASEAEFAVVRAPGSGPMKPTEGSDGGSGTNPGNPRGPTGTRPDDDQPAPGGPNKPEF